MDKKYYLGTGWKMNHTIKDSELYVKEFSKLKKMKDIEVFILPPFTALSKVLEIATNRNYHIGAQNIHWEDKGAFTGEISGKMLKELGVEYVEIGHSERRSLFGETDEIVNLKLKMCLNYGLKPIVCIGEPILIKENKVSLEFLTIQASIALKGISKDQFGKIIFAYEPVWAIGKEGKTASAEFVEQTIKGIKDNLIINFGKEAMQIPIIYGGSVNYENSVSLIKQPSVDGLFIGRAAWNAKSFLRIIELVESNIN